MYDVILLFIQDKGFLLEVEFIDATLSVKIIGGDIYSSQAVQVFYTTSTPNVLYKVPYSLTYKLLSDFMFCIKTYFSYFIFHLCDVIYDIN